VILYRFILYRFASSLLFAAGSLALLLTLFDALAHAEEIMADEKAPALSLLFYGLLRFPAILTLAIPLGALFATLATVAKMAGQQEIIALQTAGFSLYRIALVLVAGALFVGGLQFAFTERYGVQAAKRLSEWESREFEGLPLPTSIPAAPEWAIAGDYFLGIGEASVDGRLLSDVTLLRRAPEGGITRYYRAERAMNHGGVWVLRDAYEHDLETGRERREERRIIDLALDPVSLSALGDPIESLAMEELKLLASPESQVGATAAAARYRTWLQRRLAQTADAAVMVLLAVPLALQFHRARFRILPHIGTIAAGFLFLVADRLLFVMGEGGALPALAAAWTPRIFFGFAGIWLAVRAQQ